MSMVLAGSGVDAGGMPSVALASAEPAGIGRAEGGVTSITTVEATDAKVMMLSSNTCA